MITESIRNDEIHMYEKKKQMNAEYCILTAAKLISPIIETTFREGNLLLLLL